MGILSNGDRVIVDRKKVVGYFLSRTHPVGRCKSAFLAQLGFSYANADELEAAIKRIAAEGNVVESSDTGFGTKYIVQAELEGPAASTPINLICIIEAGMENPRLASIYPVSI